PPYVQGAYCALSVTISEFPTPATRTPSEPPASFPVFPATGRPRGNDSVRSTFPKGPERLSPPPAPFPTPGSSAPDSTAFGPPSPLPDRPAGQLHKSPRTAPAPR